MNSIWRYWCDWNPEAAPSRSRKRVYSLGVIVRSTSHALLSCSKIRAIRDSILNAGWSRSSPSAVRAAVISWIASRIHSSEVWCWTMNSISSCASDRGAWASRIRSSRR